MNQHVNPKMQAFCYNTCKIVPSNDLRVTAEQLPSKQTTSPVVGFSARAGFVRIATANKRRECGIDGVEFPAPSPADYRGRRGAKTPASSNSGMPLDPGAISDIERYLLLANLIIVVTPLGVMYLEGLPPTKGQSQ